MQIPCKNTTYITHHSRTTIIHKAYRKLLHRWFSIILSVIALIDIHTDLDSEKINTANHQVIDFANIKAK